MAQVALRFHLTIEGANGPPPMQLPFLPEPRMQRQQLVFQELEGSGKQRNFRKAFLTRLAGGIIRSCAMNQ